MAIVPKKSVDVLVVDDSSVWRNYLTKLLHSVDFQVTDLGTVYKAKDGTEAVAYLETKKIDIIMLDLIMPKMGGYEVLEYMKKNQLLSKISVIAISSITEAKDIVDVVKYNVPFIHKPFTFEIFTKILSQKELI